MKKIQYNNLTSSYAKALFHVSGDELDAIKKEVEFLLVFFKNQCDIFIYLSSPVNSTVHKKEIIFCMKEYFNEKLIKFIMVICLSKRFALLLSILEKFLSLVREDQNEFKVTIKSAEPLKEPDIKIITESLSFLAKIIEVNNVVDPSIVGGFVVRYGFTLIDVSLKSYLARLVDLSKREILGYSE